MTHSTRKPIAIVPLHPIARGEPTELYDGHPAAAKAAHLSYRGGLLLTAVKLVPIFWGHDWQSDTTLQALSQSLLAFLGWFVAPSGPMLQQLSEYSTNSQTIGAGTVLPAVYSAHPLWGHTVKDSQIQSALKRGALHKIIPPPDANTLYCVYLQPGTTVTDGPDASCQVFCGYHNQTSGKAPNLYYAVLPYPSCSGCTGGLSVLDALTSVTSHEVCEAVTDPIPGQGWYDDQNGEIGDICAWQQKRADGHAYQAEWSNAHGQCV